jgi:hypothetical protein
VRQAVIGELHRLLLCFPLYYIAPTSSGKKEIGTVPPATALPPASTDDVGDCTPARIFFLTIPLRPVAAFLPNFRFAWRMPGGIFWNRINETENTTGFLTG